jgi:ABC-2 type transport system permease protein
VTRSESLLFPPIIKVDKVKASASEKEGDSGAFNFLEWMYPGMIVMALLFVGLNQMKDLLIEQDEGTMRRLLSGPVTATQILAARITSSALAVAGALALLLATGSLAFGLRWGSPLPLLASCIALVFAVTGFAALLYSIARTQNQGDALGGICVILMSLLGGTLVPGQVLPGFVQGAARFTINYWGNETFRALAGGGGWSELSVHLPVLAAMAAAFTLSGAALMKMRHMRGAV